MTRAEKCCDKCWDSAERPCPEQVTCWSGAPSCHEDPSCVAMTSERLHQLRRDDVDRPAVFLGTGTCGLGAGAAQTLAVIKKWLSDQSIDADVIEVGCVGLCAMEPICDIQVPGLSRVSFHNVTADNVVSILENVIEHRNPTGDVLGQYRSEELASWPGISFIDEHPFFKLQKRWVLANCGIIDPDSLQEYMAHDGYRALSETLKGKTPDDVCDVVACSGLRGRGGGGFPTGTKWKYALQAHGEQKYLICNADEGDPGAFMDRAVIEGDPHRLLEGMAIAGYAIGATKGIVYIRAEYPLAIKRLNKAIKDAQEFGFLGYNILDSGFNFEIMVKKGAGAFVCGEETALIHSVEGKRGMPRPRPPFPAVKGLFGMPTVINNVETLSNVPGILRNGADWFSGIGMPGSMGTKVFALSGNVQRTGLVEVPMGTTLRQIVFDIGGGIPDGKAYKAVQIGGPSGGCIPEQHLDIQIGYESLKTVGAMMGSGGLVVMDETACMVDVAKFFMDFIQRESCGKCIPCREGTRRMLEILQRITRPRREESKRDALIRFQGVMEMERLAEVIRDTSLCGLGQTAPNPVLSTLRWFRNEYETHIFERKCPAGRCTGLQTYRIDPDLCKGCTVCARKCPSDAIMGARKSPHYIIPDKCISCGACVTACPFGAVIAE